MFDILLLHLVELQSNPKDGSLPVVFSLWPLSVLWLFHAMAF
jgi:hypothetical protein